MNTISQRCCISENSSFSLHYRLLGVLTLRWVHAVTLWYGLECATPLEQC